MADNQELVQAVPIEMAKLTITFAGEQGDLPDPVQYDASDADIKQMATESVRDGYVPGIDAAANADFTDFVVDRFPAKADVPFNRLSLRPKTPFGLKVTLSFKTPDAVSDAVYNLPEEDQAKAKRMLKKWVEFGECVYVDFDLDKGTATVMEV